MFVVKDRTVCIDMSRFGHLVLVFVLEPAGLMLNNSGEGDSDSDFAILHDAWTACRPIGRHGADLASLNN